MGFAPPAEAATLRSPRIGEMYRQKFAVTPTLSGVNTFPYEGKGDRFAVDEVRDSNKHSILYAELPKQQPGGAKPIAAREADAGRLVGRCRRGSAVSGTPPTELPART